MTEEFSFEPPAAKRRRKRQKALHPPRRRGYAGQDMRERPVPRWEPPAMAPGVTLAKLMSGR